MVTSRLRIIVFASVLSGFLPAGAIAAPGAQRVVRFSREERSAIHAWRKSMTSVLPPGKRCFKASYPKNEWQEVPCAAPPARSFSPRAQKLVGGGNSNDLVATVAGSMSVAEGSFDSVNGVTSEMDGNPDNYSLQLNSAYFPTAACAGAADSSCAGWQQVVYSTSVGAALVQYWLVNYQNPCPANWTQSGSGCYRSSPAVPVPAQPIANLVHLSLTGRINTDGSETIVMATPAELYTVSVPDVLGLAQHWQTAEFGVFGDANGGVATFAWGSAGATIAVRISVDNGTTNAPACAFGGLTDETNNLNLVTPCCQYGGTSPAIVFLLSSSPNAQAMCANGTVTGNVRLTNRVGER